jgi:excisionase family DNA binding protein
MPLDITDLSESLTVNEFAALLHLHRATVERLLKNGEVDYVQGKATQPRTGSGAHTRAGPRAGTRPSSP